jgi:hypothetical protein
MSDDGGDEAAAASFATKECPYCKETINAQARKCRYCGSMLGREGPSHGGTCPYCKETINVEAVKCRYCGSYVGAKGSGAAVQDQPKGGMMMRGGGGCNCGGAQGAQFMTAGGMQAGSWARGGMQGQQFATGVPETMLRQQGGVPTGGYQTAMATRPVGPRPGGITGEFGLIKVECPGCEICWACYGNWCVPYVCCEPCTITIDI